MQKIKIFIIVDFDYYISLVDAQENLFFYLRTNKTTFKCFQHFHE